MILVASFLSLFASATTPLPSNSLYLLNSQWTTQDNQKIELSHFQGKPVVMTMVYMSCRFSCPIIMGDMKTIEKKLGTDSKKVDFVLVTIDPENDTPAVLKEAAKKRAMTTENWTLLNGSADNVRELAAALGFSYRKTSAMDYAHSFLITVLDKYGAISFQQQGQKKELSTLIEKTRVLLK